MAVLKCKMCGGDLVIEPDVTVCECEYCGTKQTVPNTDDEKKLKLYERANRLRFRSEFDKAAGIYESLIEEYPEEAEAYWGNLLCKYGIEYVDDPATGDKVPTCHRSSFDSFMDDPDFEMVMENADAVARSVYREQAKQIEEIRKGIIEVSGKEQPYDIFICYKETDDIGQRTLDSLLAQDVYDALTEKGYRVFFSRISLEDKLGTEYEPYVFAALNSAAIMLAFGTSYDYFNAVWVKNEWSRFLKLMAKDKKKYLIPCYKDIDAYDMPREFAKLQAQDMGKVGAFQDLLRGIGKIIGTKTSSDRGVVNAVNPEASALVQRGNMALEDGNFIGAEGFFERALDVNPADAYAYLGKFLAAYGLSSLDDLEDKVCLLDENTEFKRAMQFADLALAKKLEEVKRSNEIKKERLRLIDALRQIPVKKAMKEVLPLLAQCTDSSYSQATGILFALYKENCITPSQYFDYKRELESQYFALEYLRKNLSSCLITEIASAAKSKGIQFKSSSLDALVEEGLLEKSSSRSFPKFSWPNAAEERERIEKEKREKKEKELRQKAAFDEACERINSRINDEIGSVQSCIDEKYAPKLHDVQKEIDVAILEANHQRECIEQEISDLQSRLSSLGFFKGKEKKAIQSQIDEAQKRLTGVSSTKDIQLIYQPKIDQINTEKQKSIDNAISEVRKKYPFPQLEDFKDV